MNVRRVRKGCMVAALAALGTSCGLHQTMFAQPSPSNAEQGVQVLTRGPVHEAFAETVTFDAEPGIAVPKAPPAAIEELPPDQRPEGANVTWIPGYWAWDDERNDFLWVSGIWRALPPGRQWLPGYWGQTGEGYLWTSGYWADAQASEIEYLPEPPQMVEEGPSTAAPSVDKTWLPGCWVWDQNRYAWRPGFWATVQPDWVWVPAHYVRAPRGYVFVDGYWDYSVGRRGVLFAPVYFDRAIYTQPGFSYSPAMVISPTVFLNHLFLRQRYGHYYFGDYYAANYVGLGFAPWFSFQSSRYGYDPFYAHERWQHRNDRQWKRRVEADFEHRRNHEEARPPHTWAAQRARVANPGNSRETSFLVAGSLDQLTKSKDSPLRFQPVAQQERQRLAQQGQQIQAFRQQRQRLEAKAAAVSTANSSKPSGPPRARLRRSPIVATSADRFGKDQIRPKRHEVLKPNLPIEPKPSSTVKSKPSPTAKSKPGPTAKSKPGPTAKSKPGPTVKSKPLKGDGARSNRQKLPPATVNRPSKQPRQAANRPPPDTQKPRTKATQ